MCYINYDFATTRGRLATAWLTPHLQAYQRSLRTHQIPPKQPGFGLAYMHKTSDSVKEKQAYMKSVLGESKADGACAQARIP